jgi:hypothetical protein
MAITQTDLDNIETAIANPVQSVRFADRSIVYDTVDEQLKARAALQQILDNSQHKVRRRQLRVYTTKGF